MSDNMKGRPLYLVFEDGLFVGCYTSSKKAEATAAERREKLGKTLDVQLYLPAPMVESVEFSLAVKFEPEDWDRMLCDLERAR